MGLGWNYDPLWWERLQEQAKQPGFTRKLDRNTKDPMGNLFTATQKRLVEIFKQLTKRIEE